MPISFSSLSGGGGGPTMRIDRITSTGSWTCPDDVTSIDVWLAGGGASGTAWSNLPSSGGGGSADFATLTVVPGTTYTVTIGGGGARVNSQAVGNPGGTSNFGGLFTVNGGTGTSNAGGMPGGKFGGGGMRERGNAILIDHLIDSNGVDAFGYHIGAGGGTNNYGTNGPAIGGGPGGGRVTANTFLSGAANSGAGGLGGYNQSASTTSAGGSGVCIIRYWSAA